MNELYSIEELPSYRDGKLIYGLAYIPKQGKAPYTTIILSSEFYCTHKSMEKYAINLAKQGYLAYIFDFLGGSEKNQSQGNVLEMSVSSEIKDLECIINSLIKLPLVDRHKLYLLGGSQGGFVSALTASRHPKQVKGIIELYPAFNIPDYIQNAYPNFTELPAIGKIIGLKVGKIYLTDMYYYQPYKELANFSGNVLIIHGTADKVVNKKYVVEAFKTYLHASLKFIEKAGHGFHDEEVVLANKYIIEFLQNDK